MTRGLIFWVLMLVWLVFGIVVHFGGMGPYGPLGSAILLFVLFFMLGWQVFGPPIRG